MTSPTPNQSLPRQVKPSHYSISLEPDFSDFKFDGFVSIELDILEDTDSIYINSIDIEIGEARLAINDGPPKTLTKISSQEQREIIIIDAECLLKAGEKAILSIKYAAKLTDSTAGFYRSSWKDETGSVHFLAVSHMEPMNARRVFPCFDEPETKSTFSITLIAKYDQTCLSNMSVAHETEVHSSQTGNKKKAVTFQKTPLMSTYLVALAVGNLQYYETHEFSVPVRVYFTPDQTASHAAYAAQLATRTLKFYEEELGISYPLPKLDMLGVPDFAHGAMENWGLLVFRTRLLLLDEKECSAIQRQNITGLIQHEIAHQWFGNLVTMKSWDALWLKEGFATWIAQYSSHQFFPKWNIWDKFVAENLSEVLKLDSLRSSHAIEADFDTMDVDPNEIFDDIAYEKGCSIIRMLSVHLQESVFMKGVRHFLQKHAYGSVVTDDLWAALSEVSGENVQEMASIWTRTVGHPVITVTEDPVKRTILLRQNRFLGSEDVKPADDVTLYPIMLGLRTNDDVDHGRLAFTTREAGFSLPQLNFFKLNSGHTGFYRTFYSDDRLQKLGQASRDGLLSNADRIGIIDDAGALAQAGYYKTSTFFSLIQLFRNEADYQVWKIILSQIHDVQDTWRFESQRIFDALQAFEVSIVLQKARELGWKFETEDTQTRQLLKTMLFRACVNSGDKEFTSAANDLFQQFVEGNRSAVHANIRKIVFSAALRQGSKESYRALVEEYERGTALADRMAALGSLGAAATADLISSTLEYALSNKVKPQDIGAVVFSLVTHSRGIEMTWSWIKDRWETLCEIMPPEEGSLGHLISTVISKFTKKEQRQDVEEFFASKNTHGINIDLTQGLDVIRSREAWLARDRSDVVNFLTKEGFLES